MKIADFDTNQKVLVIAEIGNNHEGSYFLAEELIGLAVDSGAGAVKLQTFIPEKLVTVNDERRINQLKKFQLSYQECEKLAVYAKKSGIIFLSTPFDIESAKFLEPIVPAYKIASGDNNFYPLLKAVADTAKPILLSAGLTNFDELSAAVNYVEGCWRCQDIDGNLAILHCVSSYPVDPMQANLLSIKYLAEKFNYTIGYSDHTLGIDACVVAVALGARIIEKHFTIDNQYSDFRDHRLSADPVQMRELVRKIDAAQQLMGIYDKQTSPAEKEIKSLIRRSVAANKDLNQGHILRHSDFTWVRPGIGIPVGDEARLIGKKIKQQIAKGQLILADSLEE